jgi:hypothetical protein
LVAKSSWFQFSLPYLRHESGHGGAMFISVEFINPLVTDREPEVDLSMALAITLPGLLPTGRRSE